MTNRVTVYPGEKSFDTIQAAIDSITKVEPGLEYQLECTPGTYNESITLKPHVFVVGQNKQARDTIIHWDSTLKKEWTVNAASNSGVIACTIVCNGNKSTLSICAVKTQNVTNFHLEGCNIITQNNAGIDPGATCTVSLNFMWNGEGVSKSTVEISGCDIKNMTTGGSGSHQAISVGNDCTATIYNSSISTNAGFDGATAILSYNGGAITVEISDVTAPSGKDDYALEIVKSYLPEGSLKAIQCKIDGQVSPGVEVIDG